MTVSPSTELREAGSHQSARRRIGRRLSSTHVLIAVVVILAFVLNLLVLQDRSATTLVAVAEERLIAGSVLDPGDLRLVPVDSGFEGLSDLVSEGEIAALDGSVLSRSIEPGGLVDQSALLPPGSDSGLRSMSLPVPSEHAAGGALTPGDRVDVISVIDGKASYIATDLAVVSVAADSSGAIGTISEYHLVVSVEADEALDLAQALDRGSLEVLRSTGAEPIREGSQSDP